MFRQSGINYATLIRSIPVVQPGATVEVEVRFGFFKGTFISSVLWNDFIRLQTKLDSFHLNPVVSEIHDTKWDTPHGDIRFRKITHPGEETILEVTRKRKFPNRDLREYNVRLAVATEEKLGMDLPEERPNLVRTVQRRSYLLEDGAVRVDLSTTVMHTTEEREKEEEREETGKTQYEVEVELVDTNINETSIRRLDDAATNVFKWLHDSLNLYTQRERDRVTLTLNRVLGGNGATRYVNRELFTDARNIKPRDLKWGGIVATDYRSEIGYRGPMMYKVTPKADGVRKVITFDETGIWMMFPPNEYNLLYRGDMVKLKGTIIEGESIPHNKRTTRAPEALYLFYVFDCLALQGNIEIQKQSHGERYNQARMIGQKLRNRNFFVEDKSFESFATPEGFFKACREMLEKGKVADYDTDGLMFIPDFPPYNPQSERFLLRNRTLDQHPDICKWKPQKRITIDFRIKWASGDNPLQLYIAGMGKDRQEFPFRGSDFNPYYGQIDHSHALLMGIPNDTIVEFYLDAELSILVPVGIRFDKKGPNREDIAIDNWDRAHNPIPESAIVGNDFYLMKKYHNQIKRSLFSRIKSGSIILDIGSGYTGVQDWYRFEHVIAVEPDSDNITELKRRLDKAGLTEKVTILQTVGQNTELITETVKRITKNQGVDAITFMFSLTFFWESVAILNAIKETIVKNIKEDGEILYITFDGDSVHEYFNNSLGSVELNEIVVYDVVGDGIKTPKRIGDATLKILDQPGPGIPGPTKILVNIPGTIIKPAPGAEIDPEYPEGQIEYLVRINDLASRLKPHGFDLVERYAADQEKMLNGHETMFTSMVSYGIFKRGPMEYLDTPEKDMEELPRPPPLAIDTGIAPPKPPVPPPGSPARPGQGFAHIPPKRQNNRYTDHRLPALPVGRPVDIMSPAPGDDVSIPLKSTWAGENLVRIATIGDGSCFFHSFCKAAYSDYQENNSYGHRSAFVASLRKDLAAAMALESESHPGHTYWESLSRIVFPQLLLNQLQGLQNAFEHKHYFDISAYNNIDYTLSGIQGLLDSRTYLGDEVYQPVADFLGIDIYILHGTAEDLHINANTARKGEIKPSVVILGNTFHFEVVGIRKPEGIQTVFTADDPFLQKIRSRAEDEEGFDGYVDPTPYSIEELFVQSAMDTWGSTGIIIYPSVIDEIFKDKPNDPFMKLVQIAKESLGVNNH